MVKALARSGDVSATAATATPASGLWAGATSGTWSIGALNGTATDVDLTTNDVVTSDGRAVVTQAVCTFSFKGTNGQTNVQGESTVTLKPGSRQLTLAGVAPLVDGDSAKDTYGNTVSVSSTATLLSD